jgi:hypothetical protein
MAISPFLKKTAPKAEQWLELVEKGDIRPYVYLRPDNKISMPGSRHRLDWFPGDPICIDPLNLDEIEFAERIYHLENTAFGPSAMAIPRWVFYDCAVVPGFVAGFAMKTKALSPAIRKAMGVDTVKNPHEWTPLSLFIIIPTMKRGEWVAHNLCAVNALVEEKDRLYALGFLSKAFGLWYANVEYCCGMTQWGNSALTLHAHFGHLQILTAYTPVHSHARTITYRSEVHVSSWEKFFTHEEDFEFLEKYEPSGLLIDPSQEQSMIDLHRRIQSGQGPYYLGASDLAAKKLASPLIVYKMKGN